MYMWGRKARKNGAAIGYSQQAMGIQRGLRGSLPAVRYSISITALG